MLFTYQNSKCFDVLGKSSDEERSLCRENRAKRNSYRQSAPTELRGVWVTTVRNNDFPSPAVFENGFNVDLFKLEFQSILDTCKQFNLNALFFQVRPEGDAFYPSTINPWSQYLTGKQGVAPRVADFDPVAYMIEATHDVGIEFHAWLNPYRLSPSNNKSATQEEAFARLTLDHYANHHTNWVYFYNGELYLDPGVPAVNEFIVETVAEILKNYNIDAIILDDFFYPYPYIKAGETVTFANVAPDESTYQKYRVSEEQTIDEWREANINALVYQLHQEIQRFNRTNKTQVEFGISPFGIWSSSEQTLGGSPTSSQQLSSLEEWVNTKFWIEAGWLDYVVPQVYWEFDNKISPFDVVAKWWNDIVAGTKVKLYLGLGLYLYEEDQMWPKAEEILHQLQYARTLTNVSGFVFFTYHNLVASKATTKALQEVLPKLQQELRK